MSRIIFTLALLASYFIYFPVTFAGKDKLEETSSVRAQLKRIKTHGQDYGKGKTVKIFGAGMAGLTAAHELIQLGYAVDIIEASSRVGGRVWTHYFDSTDEYGELGAMRIPESHDYTHYYIDLMGLSSAMGPFVSVHQNPNCLYNLRGQVVRMSEAQSFLEKEYSLSPLEAHMLTQGPPPIILYQHLLHAIERLRSSSSLIEANQGEKWGGLFGEMSLTDAASEFEDLTLGEFLERRVESPGAKELLGVTTGLELWWDKSLTMFLREAITDTGTGLQEIAGGFSQLPNTLADRLQQKGVHIRKNTEVVSIHLPKDSKEKVYFKTRPTDPHTWDACPTQDSVSEEKADFVICTIPFGVLRTMDLVGLSPLKMEAIRNISYASSTKVLLHFKDRFWEKGEEDTRILGGASMSDGVTRCTYYPSDHARIRPSLKPEKRKPFNGAFTVGDPLTLEPNEQFFCNDKPSPGVLLGSYGWGQDALRLGMLSSAERAEVVIEELKKIHPELRDHLHPTQPEKSICWDSYRWSRGAFCGMRPNEMRKYHHASKKHEGNLFFAGEHCSLDPGWIQGAIKSGLDAVEQLLKVQ